MRKFDGSYTRNLSASEIRQIGGRAGRYTGQGVGKPGTVGAIDGNIGQIVSAFADGATSDVAYSEAFAGPTIEHIETLSHLLGSDRLGDALDFFVAHVAFTSSNLKQSQLADIRVNAGIVDRHCASLSMSEKWQLACAPVGTGQNAVGEQTTFRYLLRKIAARENTELADACPQPQTDKLADLELWVNQLTLYVWVGYRFPEAMPHLADAQVMRDDANRRIIALLSSGKRVDLPVTAPSNTWMFESYYDA